MSLRNVGNFMGDDPSQLIFPIRRQQQASVDSDKIVGQGECVDTVVPHQKKRERNTILVGVGDDALTNGIEIGIQLHIVQHHVAFPQLLHDFQSQALFFVGAEIHLGRIADIGQVNGLGD